uniref:NADH-ubiquinone oxidoreductase chain 4 n=1 Tax=Chlamydomonas moewusii TaxID=3054 RepID=O47543_CHLMO|nr:NADH dehydrogenase subunit 4 [Chlamydomonas moewusii]AAC39340.1 NADH dehydrogenase subunit 4 [Chlamydomonas moewusii]QRM91389.1 NADH dehydrogenase subunit 4 [Chlamydomonas moewusii]
MILLTSFAFFIPNGVDNKYTHKEKTINGLIGEGYYSITKTYCLFVTMVVLLWTLYLWSIYDAIGHSLQMVVIIERLHISFGVDSMSLSLTLLTSALFPICIMVMRTFKGYITFLLLEIVIYGALNVLDLLGFYILFEASLILLFLLIGRSVYGNIEAAYKIVLYTMGGSLILLPIIFVLYAQGGSTSLIYLLCNFGSQHADAYQSAYYLLSERQMILGWGLFIVFAVKIPLMPVHLWLPEAHVAAPTAGSVLLAGVLLKLGGLGFIRFMIPILPSFTASIFPLVCCMCLASFLYSTLSTIRQIDLKKIVAYSSIGHMAMITLTIFTMSEYSAYNATFMMIAHGLVSPCLFLLVGLLYDRFHTKLIFYFTGLAAHLPIFSIMFLLCTLANLSFPLFPNFLAEFLCLTSLFSVHSLYAYVFCICQVLGTVASFWAFNRIIHGVAFGLTSNYKINQNASACDATRRVIVNNQYTTPLNRLEFAMVLTLMIGIIWLGVKPMA